MASQLVATAARLSAQRVPLEYSVGIRRAYMELCGFMSDRYDQQPRRPERPKWLRSIKGAPVPVTGDDMLRHLAGEATYAATYADSDGLTCLLVADDDHGGIERAQETIDNLDYLGLPAFGIARNSINGRGEPKHKGSRVFLRVTRGQAQLLTPAWRAVLAEAGYSTDEVMHRAELPFGRSMWTPKGDEYGQLILPHREPQRITSGYHGMELLGAAGLPIVDAEYLMQWTPPVVEPAPIVPTALPVVYDETDENFQFPHAYVVQRFNDAMTCRTVLERACWRPAKYSKRNFHCGCNGHAKGDNVPSVGLSSDDKLAYFNTPGCAYANTNALGKPRAWSAFALHQHINHGGSYLDAVDDARALLGIPAWRPKVTPATEIKEDVTVERIIEEIGRRLEGQPRLITASQRDVLRKVAVLCREAGGAAEASWETLAELTGWSIATVRRAAARLEALGFIRKHSNVNAVGAWAPNVLEILPQPTLWGDLAEIDHSHCNAAKREVDQSILSTTIKEREIMGDELNQTELPGDSLLFNSPRIQIDLEWFEEFKRRHPQPGRIKRYAAIPERLRAERLEAAERVSLAADDETFWTRGAGRSAQSWPLKPTPKHSTRQAPQPTDDEPEDTPRLAHWRRVVNLMRHAAATGERAVETVGMVVDVPASPSLIAPAPHPTPADTGHNAPSLEAQMDAAAARGDKAGLLALLNQLGAWDRALANAKYDAVLCKFKRAGRAA